VANIFPHALLEYALFVVAQRQHQQQKIVPAEGQYFFFTEQGRTRSFVHCDPPLSSSLALVFSGPFALGTSLNAENGRRPDETGVSASSVFLGNKLYLFGP